MMDLALVLRHVYPDIDLLRFVRLQNDGPGCETYIASWTDPRPQPTPEQIAAAWPEAQRAAILAAIDAHARALRDAAVAGISPAEMAAWPIKLAQAQAGAGAMIEMEAAARGVPLTDLIAKILAKAAAMAALEASIAGTAGRHQDAVRAAADPAAYDWSAGWPEV